MTPDTSMTIATAEYAALKLRAENAERTLASIKLTAESFAGPADARLKRCGELATAALKEAGYGHEG